MTPPRSALPLPRYVRRKPLKGRWGYFFEPPTCARKAGCPVEAEALGPDYRAAVERAETILLPQFDAWWRGTGDQSAPAGPSLDWVFAEYRADRRYTRLELTGPVRDWLDRDLPAARLGPLVDAMRNATDAERSAILDGLAALRRLLPGSRRDP